MTPERWQQVNEILDAVWERDAAGRAAFLDQACADNPELRRDVEVLLASDQNADEFLDAPAMDVAEIGEAALALAIERHSEDVAKGTPGSSDLTGTRVGRYTIQGLIGKGGMGAVYRAVREDDFRMQVAIKLLKGTDTEAALGRFRAERQILAGLQHPNIARLLDGGATESGLPYFVMEYVDGTPLLEYAAPLPVRRRLELFRSVCQAVQYAHQHQVVHRDIKPANILVTREGIPKLLDFGIAKLLDPTVEGTMALTGVGGPLMTPGYASPEQVRGEPVTRATDIYSLGTVLYELLTGRRAHALETYSAEEILKEICTRQPPKPSAVVKELDPDLDNIVLMALRKEPERRYASVEEFFEDLGRFLEDLPVQARRESLLYRSRKFVKRNRGLITAGTASAVFVLALVTGLQRFGPSSGGAAAAIRSIAVLPLENLSHDPQQEPFADGMTDALIGDLGKIRSLRVISRDSVMRYKGVHKPAAQTARELKASALIEGSVLRSGDRVRVSYRLTAGAMDHVLWTETFDRDLQDVPALQSDAARAIAREIQIQLTPQEEARLSLTRPVSQQAYEAYLQGRYQLYKHTREGYEKSLQHFKEAIDIDSAYAPAWAGLADGYYEMSSAVLPAREAMPKARAAALKALAIDGTLAEAHATLAQIQGQYDWDWATAEKSYKRALELNASYAPGHQYYSFYLAEQGRMDEAIREMAEAQRLDPLPPWRATNVAWMYYLARRNDEAIAQYHKILELDSNSGVTHSSLGLAYEQKGLFEQAIAEFLKARSLDNNCDECLVFLGHAYGASGKRKEASHTLEELLEPSRQRHVDAYWVGLIYVGLGDAAKTFEWFEKAYQERSEELLFLKLDPRLDALRSDPRFKSLVRRIGLPP